MQTETPTTGPADTGPTVTGLGRAGPVEAGLPAPGTAPGGNTVAEEPWEQFLRWGPYVLLTLAGLLAAGTAGLLMSRGQMYAAAALTPAALALQLAWDRSAPDRHRPTPLGSAYYSVRIALAFTLTWLNPFFAIYAVLGYFDADRMLPGRWAWGGLLGTAVTMAGSQSGGLPPANGTQWAAFGGLFAVHVALTAVFGSIADQESKDVQTKAATIAELERTNARLAQALDENAGLQRRLLLQAREAGISDERRRLAIEIHDTIAQGLIGIVTQLQAAADSTDPEAARTHVERAAGLARQSLGEARRSVQDLGPGALEHDTLPVALTKAVSAWSASAGVRADLVVTGTVEALHDEVEATLLRIAQEALTNVARHAGAGRVGVTLSYMDDEVALDVRDDGRGFAPHSLPKQGATGGFGLGGMRARAERIAGSVQIESEPGRGTAVSARVPLVHHG